MGLWTKKIEWNLSELAGTAGYHLMVGAAEAMPCLLAGDPVGALAAAVKAITKEGTAELAAEALSGIIKGVSLADRPAQEQFVREMRKTLPQTLDAEKLPRKFFKALQEQLLDPERFFEIWTAPNRLDLMKEVLRNVLLPLDGLAEELSGEQLERFAASIKQCCEDAIQQKPALKESILLELAYREKCGGKVHTDNVLYAESFTQPLFLHRAQLDSPVTLQKLYVEPGYVDNIVQETGARPEDPSLAFDKKELQKLKKQLSDLEKDTDLARKSPGRFSQICAQLKVLSEKQQAENQRCDEANTARAAAKKAEIPAEEEPRETALTEGLKIFFASSLSFLLVEGDAGTGKTTLTSWLNYHALMRDKTADQLLGGRSLVTVRLRDLAGMPITEGKYFSRLLLEYLQAESFAELDPANKGLVLWLDGFDELCMIKAVSYNQKDFFKDLYEQARAKNFKVVLTTRPRYFEEASLQGQRYRKFTLRHFDADKRCEWLSKYEADCKQTVAAATRDLIENMGDKSAQAVCDTPMMLYMLAADPITAQYQDNPWAMYRHVFGTVLSKTDYNRLLATDTRKPAHHVDELRTLLYRISEEIAFAMYCKGNREFFLREEVLEEILDGLKAEYPILEDADTQTIVEKCCGLCCYWKEGPRPWNGQREVSNAQLDEDLNDDLMPQSSSRGAVEFLHNNIRDFFLAEKLYRELNKAAAAMQQTEEADCRPLADPLTRLLRYAMLEPCVIYFVFCRAKYEKQRRETQTWVKLLDFAGYEAADPKITAIMHRLSYENLAHSGEERGAGLAQKAMGSPYWQTYCVLRNTMGLYRAAYEPYFQEGEVIHWCDWQADGDGAAANMVEHILRWDRILFVCRFSLGSRGDYRKSEFGEAGLRYAGLSESDCSEANLRFADLSSADLAGAVLKRSTLTGANLCNANLCGAKLCGANLCGAELCGADLRGADLTGADLSEAELTYADLTGADLTHADLTGANLTHADLAHAALFDANLHGADLIGATLPGDVQSFDQAKQIRHLQKMKIKGLQLDDPDSKATRLIQRRHDAEHLQKPNP